jgi:hypothetical protein
MLSAGFLGSEGLRELMSASHGHRFRILQVAMIG